MAGRLQESTERLVYLRQLASWQTLARKMAHEVKNSLTPIRLTVEEMLARFDDHDRAFMIRPANSWWTRSRPWNAAPRLLPVRRRAAGRARPLDMNALLQERIAFLKTAHPEVAYDSRLADGAARVGRSDLVKGILTNLLENAAEAAGDGGRILGVTAADGGKVAIEVHDSGPGLSEQARPASSSPPFLSRSAAWGWAFPSRAKAPC